MHEDDRAALEQLCVELVKEGKPAEAIRFCRDEARSGLREAFYLVRGACFRQGMKEHDLPAILAPL